MNLREDPSNPTNLQVLEVQAPCTMEAGYRFMATSGDKSFPVTVPPGGVKKGEMIAVPYPSIESATEVTPFFVNNHNRSVEAPLGHWKDNLFDCFRLGVCHPSFLNALCCSQLLMAQILTRLKLNWFGNPAPDGQWRQTFARVAMIVAVYWILTIMFAPGSVWIQDEETGKSIRDPDKPPPPLQLALYNTISWSFGFYTLIVLTKLRRKIRLRYEIPPTNDFLSGECEDCCVSFWCGCCSVAQMARQTADYENQSAACCSPTGMGASIHPRESILTV